MAFLQGGEAAWRVRAADQGDRGIRKVPDDSLAGPTSRKSEWTIEFAVAAFPRVDVEETPPSRSAVVQRVGR
jgi:hypothetical protein